MRANYCGKNKHKRTYNKTGTYNSSYCGEGQSESLDYPLPKQKKKTLHKLKNNRFNYIYTQISTKENSLDTIHGYKNLLAQ